jgi:hypothetical protein
MAWAIAGPEPDPEELNEGELREALRASREQHALAVRAHLAHIAGGDCPLCGPVSGNPPPTR